MFYLAYVLQIAVVIPLDLVVFLLFLLYMFSGRSLIFLFHKTCEIFRHFLSALRKPNAQTQPTASRMPSLSLANTASTIYVVLTDIANDF